MEVWTGFVVGLVGSLHCVGMCGPIVLALPVFGENNLSVFAGRLLYNLGRIVTYSILGAVFGLFGSSLVLFGLQQHLSIAIGAAILLYVLTPRKIKTRVSKLKFYAAIVMFLKSNFSKLINKRTNNSLFTIGLLNGLLPCGFVYVGIAGAVSTSGWSEGAVYMALFGLGTTPIMLAAAMLGKVINFNIRAKINKLIPAFAAIFALLFILRGLNLGIPYISPKFEYPTTKTEVQEVECCP
ncbi:MAG: cytochrome bioproteinis protein CycZ [Ignavibacteria bacterium]|nr:MAG: cytochrome bioproteinis protein CycZ [Ignavibacteria bacterium]KAF0161895.1 MAG: cytochrome bioproteinis protein CycZ [Ignavibacteria bacterium]